MTDSGNRPSFRVAIFGLGAAAERIHLPACASLPGVAVTSACEPDATRREQVGRRFGVPRLYPDASSLLADERPDVVIIGTPPASHRDLCLLALDHGAHVLCEKPFVGSVAEANEVIAAADHKGLLVRVNNQYRFMAMYRVAQAQLAAGAFGPLYFVQCWQQMFHPPSMERNWRAGLVQSVFRADLLRRRGAGRSGVVERAGAAGGPVEPRQGGRSAGGIRGSFEGHRPGTEERRGAGHRA